MSDREDALQEIAAIAKRSGLSLADITQALTAAPTVRAEQQSSGIISKLFGYIGGILIFSGICVFVGMQWDSFGPASRVIATLGTGYMLFLMGLAAAGDEKYDRAATPLFLMSSALQPTGVFVMLDEYSSGGDPAHGVLYMAFLMLAQHGLTFLARPRTVLAFTSITFGSLFFFTLCDVWDINEKMAGTIMGASLLCIAYALANSRHAAISAFWTLVGATSLLTSVFLAVENTPFELTYFGLTAFLVFLSTSLRSRMLLFVSTMAMIGYIVYYTGVHFADTIGWPLALVVSGVALIGLGSFALRLNRKYIRQT